MDKLFGIQTMVDFKKEADHIIINLYNTTCQESSSSLDKEDIITAKEDIRKSILNNSYDYEKFANFLISNQYHEEKIAYFIKTLKERRNELLHSALVHFNSAHGESLQDFDWFLKLVLGTCDLKTIRYPLLQLTLSTITTKGNLSKKIYDINSEMLVKAINILDNAVNS